jgi:hypothetical protein
LAKDKRTMEATAAQRLHDTLALLRPKGKVGGLGMGSSFGVSKRDDDGLPKNPLYSRFVKEGQGNFSLKKFKHDDGEKSDKGNDEDINQSKNKDNKKEKKAKKVKEKKEAAEAAAAEKAAAEKKKKHKRKRSNEVSEKEDAAPNKLAAAAVEVDWSSAIKAALEEAAGAAIEVKALRKTVLKVLKSSLGGAEKAAQKTQFAVALEACPKVTVLDGVATLAAKKKKKKDKQ